MTDRVFLLSPAFCGGKRAGWLLNPDAQFELARRLQSDVGAPIGEVFQFVSGLYFRGKLAYATAFARPLDTTSGTWVITPDRGLLHPDKAITAHDLLRFRDASVDADDPRYREPLERDVRTLADGLPPEAEVVLLGSIATDKYCGVLVDILAERLRFPAEFVGRGDMSRGGLLLRCVREQRELEYIPVVGATRRGSRPAKLPKQP